MMEAHKHSNLGKPVKVLYKGKWRKIYWEPCILVDGKVLDLQELLKTNLLKCDNQEMKGGRNETKRWI